jgi:hypothetical protein
MKNARRNSYRYVCFQGRTGKRLRTEPSATVDHAVRQFGGESHVIQQGYRSKIPGRTGQFDSKGSARYFPSVMPIPANIMPPQRWHFLALLRISSEI